MFGGFATRSLYDNDVTIKQARWTEKPGLYTTNSVVKGTGVCSVSGNIGVPSGNIYDRKATDVSTLISIESLLRTQGFSNSRYDNVDMEQSSEQLGSLSQKLSGPASCSTNGFRSFVSSRLEDTSVNPRDTYVANYGFGFPVTGTTDVGKNSLRGESTRLAVKDMDPIQYQKYIAK